MACNLHEYWEIFSLADADFTQIFEMLVEFGPSEFEKRVLVQTSPDTLLEGREDFTIELAPVSDRIVIAEHSAIIIIEETTNGSY